MIEFRDAQAREKGFELLVHINEDGVRDGVGPFTHGSNVHTHVMKTVGLRQALDKYKFDAAFGGARRDEENHAPRSAFFVPQCSARLGSEEPETGNVEGL